MPQVQLHQDCFDVQIQIAGDAPADVHRLADRLLKLVGSIVAEALKALLRARLREELGPRGQPGNRFGPDCEAECPGCGSGAAYRKGLRTRTVEVKRLGAIEVQRPYLECKRCGRSYTPYAGGVPEQRRYGRKALRRPMEAALETSYRRGAEACPESPSASTLWRRVQDQSPEGSRALPETGSGVPWLSATCVADSTPIPARKASEGRKQASHSLSIAHLVEPDPEGGPGGRPALQRHPVAARVGSETRLRADLRSVPIRSLITDGKMEVGGAAPFVGRCRWHLPRSIRQELYNDDVSGDFNERLTDSLRSLVHEGFPNGVAAREALTRWAAACRLVAPQSATTVERAAPAIAIYDDRPEAFTVETTAPAEREMRELNRRFENGGQWTRPGAENLLRWHQVYRHAPAQWTDWFDRKRPTEEPTVSQC
jgi:YgiT-type zinc finger domain-containing protein